MKTLILLARQLKKDIGCHHAQTGKYCPSDKYQTLQLRSDEAVGLAKYLICQLDSSHSASIFASAVGMPGYINLRGKL